MRCSTVTLRVIVDDLADVDVIDQIAAEMAPFVEATPGGSDDFSGRTTTRTGALVARSPSSHELIAHPTILDVTGRLLHRAQSFQLHLTQVIAIGPDSPGQRIHRDQWAFDFFEFPVRLRRPVQHDLGDDRIHRGQRRDAADAGESTSAGQLRPHRRRHRAGGDDEGVVPALHGQGVPRRRRQPIRHDPRRGSTSPTTSGGCARRRTSTCRCRATSPRNCPTTCSG